MGNKYSTQMNQIKESIFKIDEYVNGLAYAVDLVNSSANEFVSLLQGKDTDQTDACLSDVDRLHQRSVKMTGMAVHLLMSVAACNEKKNNTVKHVNECLHSVRRDVKSICERDFKGFRTLRLANYPADENADIQQEHWNDVNENFRRIFSDSLKSLPVKPGLEVKVDQLDERVLKLQKAIDKVSLDQTVKELQKTDVKQKHPRESTKMDIKEQNNPVFASIDAPNDCMDNDESEEQRNAAKYHRQVKVNIEKQLKTPEDLMSKRVEYLEKEVGDVRKELELAKCDNSHLQEDMMKKNISEKNLQISVANLEKEKTLLQKTTKEAEEKALSEIESLKECNQKLEQENFDMNKKTSKMVEDLQKEQEDVRNQLEDAKFDNSRLQEKIMEKNCLEKTLQTSVADLEKEKQLLQENAMEAEEKAMSEIKSLKESNQKFQHEISKLEKEIDELKRKKYLKVQIYSQQRGDQITDIENELIALLKSKMSDKDTEVDFIKCFHPSNIQKDKPLLNLCINASRLGTDASNVLTGIKVTSNMALLVLHLKNVHALPSQASNRVLVGQQFKDLGGIFDMAFLSDKGIYSCEMNENSITQVLEFIWKAIEASQAESLK